MVALSAVVAGVEDGLTLVVTGILARLDVMLLVVGGNSPVPNGPGCGIYLIGASPIVRLGSFCESLAADNLLITEESSGFNVSRGNHCFVYGSYT